MYDLWPPTSYPALAYVTPGKTGCTRDAWALGLTELTANTPAEQASTFRSIRPLFVKGQGGVLRWNVTVTPLGGAELDVQQRIVWLDDDLAQVGRWTGQLWHIDAAMVLSARQPVPRLATSADLTVLSLCDTDGGEWTELDILQEQIPADDPYVPPPVDPTFGDLSPDGVAPPPPPAGLPGFEANSAARRSPQVRWCQINDSVRPDLVAKRNAREV